MAFVFKNHIGYDIQTSNICSNDTELHSPEFGADAAIDKDIIAVGAYNHDNDRGALYIFDGSGKEIHKAMDPDVVRFDLFGDEFGSHVYASSKFIAVRTWDYVANSGKTGCS